MSWTPSSRSFTSMQPSTLCTVMCCWAWAVPAFIHRSLLSKGQNVVRCNIIARDLGLLSYPSDDAKSCRCLLMLVNLVEMVHVSSAWGDNIAFFTTTGELLLACYKHPLLRNLHMSFFLPLINGLSCTGNMASLTLISTLSSFPSQFIFLVVLN